MKIIKKLYEDYFKKSRLPEYENLLCQAKCYGYKMVGIYDFCRLLRDNSIYDMKIIVNRHDVDTSPKIAKKMFEIEKKVYGKDGSSTYYFRNRTIDKELIRDIDEYGYETGYHYEEIANYAKKNKIFNKKDIVNHIDVIQGNLINDLQSFRDETGSKSLTISSHGDFANVRLGISNYELTRDERIRTLLGIEIEAYDSVVENNVDKRIADHLLVNKFTTSAIEEMGKGTQIILLLTHPRNWEVDLLANTKENIIRVVEDIRWNRLTSKS